MEIKKMAQEMVRILDAKLAKDIQVIQIDELSILADYFIMATGTSATHVKTLAEEVDFQMGQKHGLQPKYQDTGAPNWKVLDYIDVVVHVFDEQAREFYNLERLWADAKIVEIEMEAGGADEI